MTSTQNCNYKYNYACEKKQSSDLLAYRLNSVFSEQKNPAQMAVLGSIPSKMNAQHFSYNSIDVESRLRGIQSCNLEGPSFNPELKKKDFYTQTMFDNNLKDNIYIPRPFYHDSSSRKGFHNI
uniref:Uncharacterized protein n=1 Tax=viral metagenome TaxID=1070528 RepID=A0A6C0KLF5_9ZZZZ